MKQLACLSLAALALALAAAPKPPRNGVLYYNSFDNSLTADYAAGQAAPMNAVGARLVPDGRVGKGYMQDAPGALRIAAKGNVKPEAGTIAVWVKPVNWSGKDNFFHQIFTVGAVKDKRRTFQLYKYYNGHFMLLARNPAVKGNVAIYETRHYPQWKPGEWHHVAFSWSKADNRTVLYTDGEPMIGPYNEDIFPQTLDHILEGVSFNHVVKSKFWDENHRTVMDELYIFDYAVGDGVIADLMRAGTKDTPPEFTIPRTTAPPKLDGVITPGEYADFFTTNTFVETGKAGFYPRETRLYTAYDDENLYVTFQSRTKGGDQNIEILARRDKRDSDVWMDDAVEVVAMSPDLKTRVQVVCNSIGTIYDARNGTPAHNGRYEVANLIEGVWWVCEMKLPFRELGMPVPKPGDTWRIHFSRDWKNPFVFASLADSTDFHDPATTPRWTFGDAKGTASLRMDVEKIQSKQLRVKAASTGAKAPLTASVYTLTHAGALHPLRKAAVPAGGEAALDVDLDRVDITKFQNKLGFLLTRADGAVLQRAEYVMRSYPPMALSAALLSAKQAFLLGIDISGLPAALDAIDLECDFTENGKSLRKWTIEKPAGRILTAQVAPTAWSHAKEFRFTVNAVERATRRSLLAKEHRWTIPAPEFWRNSTAGIDQTVPPPWTPVTRQGNAVHLWNRVYTVQPNGLPAAIVSGGKPLLSRPVELVVCGAGTAGRKRPATEQGLAFGNLRYLETERQDEVKFQTEAADADLAATLSGRIEFDGFAWFELKVAPKRPGAALAQVQLRFAVPEAEINYGHLNRAGTAYVELFTADKLPQSFPFCPQILLGNDYRALEFCMETDRFYFPEHRKDAITMRREGDSRVITVSMVAAPRQLDGEAVYGFGWQAAPVKPLPKGWRAWIQHYGGKYAPQSDLFQHWSWSRWYGFLRPIDAKEMHTAYAKWKTIYPKMKVQPYFCQYILSMISEEYKLYGVEWSSVPRTELMEFGPRYPGKSVVACNGSLTYIDFWMENLKRFLDEFPEIKGCYWDSIDPRSCENELHGHGWRDSQGKLHPTRDILNIRDFYKRAYKIIKQKHPDAVITGHSSARRNLPTFAFCDVVYDGEQFVSRVSADPDYANILDDNYCRSFFGTQYGIVPMLMPAYYNNEKMATTEVHPTETMYLHSLVYGFIIHSHRINNRVTDSILDITLPFGIGEAEFIPPYEAAAQAKYVKLAAQGDLRMGVYRNPAGRLLVAVGNFGAAKATAVLDFAARAPVTERRSGKALGNGRATVEIPPHNFVLLEQ